MSSFGRPLPNFTAMGSISLTPSGGGTITLVAPVITEFQSAGNVFGWRTASASTLTLHFVPEPSAAALALLGMALTGTGCLVAGRR